VVVVVAVAGVEVAAGVVVAAGAAAVLVVVVYPFIPLSTYGILKLPRLNVLPASLLTLIHVLPHFPASSKTVPFPVLS
jgi:hypothetical protein